jgi:hypothetical protein
MSWQDVKNQGTNSNGGASTGVKYLRLEVGSTTIRVAEEEPYSRWTHWIPEANEGKGMVVDCIGKDCPVCAKIAADKKAKIKSKYSSRKLHSLNVIHKKADGTKEMVVLEQGNKVFNGLLVLLEQMGDLRNYDVKIVKTGTTFSDTDYNVLPTFPPVPMTAEEQAMTKFTKEQIEKKFTKEQISMLMAGAKIDAVLGRNTDGTEAAPFDANPTAQVDFTRPVQA